MTQRQVAPSRVIVCLAEMRRLRKSQLHQPHRREERATSVPRFGDDCLTMPLNPRLSHLRQPPPGVVRDIVGRDQIRAINIWKGARHALASDSTRSCHNALPVVNS